MPSFPFTDAAIAVVLATAATASPPVLAQAPAQDGSASTRSTVYQADYFTSFAPSTALDIVRRVPGFVIEETEGDVRGYSGTAGNVVLNGARPSTKSERLTAVLSRIPASRVLRVEVAPGDLFGSDYAGKNQVLNVVLSQDSGIDGNVTASLDRIYTGELQPNLEVSALIRSGTSTFNLSAKTSVYKSQEDGFDEVRRFSDGALLERRDKVNAFTESAPALSANWAKEDAADKSAHINLRYSPGRFKLRQTNHVTPTSGPQRDDRLFQDYRNTAYEIGGDVSRPLGGGAIKIVALGNRRDRDNFDVYYNRIDESVVGGSELGQTARYDEALGRISWSHPKVAGFSFELGSELAYNRLENFTQLYEFAEDGSRERIDLPIDEAVVDELRTETHLNLGRQLSKSLRLDTALAYETSKLTVSGDVPATRTLRFFKPGATIDWKGPSGWHAQLGIQRKVAQLDFYDFISSAELANDRVNGGNAELVPQRSWEARLTIDRPMLGKGLIKLELGYDRVNGLQDRILTDDGFDAPGNLGTGKRKFARFTFDSPLDRIGLKSTSLRFDLTLQDTKVRDPLSGQDRSWSGFWPTWRYDLELRRDVGKWSYGTTWSDRAPNAFYRTDEIDQSFNIGIFAVGFIEYRPDKRTTLRVDVDNALGTSAVRNRLFYDPDRSSPVPLAEERRERNSHRRFSLTLVRTFGGGATRTQ